MNPRPSQQTSGRAAKLSQLKKEQTRQTSRRSFAWASAVVAAVALIGGAVTWAIVTSRPPHVDLSAVKVYAVPHRNHTLAAVTYPQTPPVGGDHNPTWLNCGIYTARVPNENAVHDLEHGAVWVTYRPDLPAAQVSDLQKLVRGQTDLTLSPYPNLPAPVVASAWGVQLRLSGVSDQRLPAFIAKYKQGPQSPEPGAPCTGGVGTPAG